MHTYRRRMFSRGALAVAIAAMSGALVVAGCGSDDDDGGGGGGQTSTSGAVPPVAEAKKAADAAQQAPAFTLKAPSFPTDGLEGKTVAWISQFYGIPFSENAYRGFKEASAVMGVKTTLFDANGDLVKLAQGIQQAIAAKADLILIQGIQPAKVKTAMLAAKRANIPVTTLEAWTAGTKPPSPGAPVAADTSDCFPCQGRALGVWAIASSNAEVDAAVITASDTNPPSKLVSSSFEREVKRYCPDCRVKMHDVPGPANWATKIGPLVQTIVRSEPDTNFVMPVYDAMTTYAIPAVKAAGGADRVSVISTNASAGLANQIATGDIFTGDAGSNPVWLGWAAADNAFRVLAGVPALADEEVPVRLLTKQVFEEPGVDPDDPSTWFGDADFEAGYKQIWGVQ